MLEESRGGLEAMIVRPRFVWGRGDTTLLPLLVEGTRSGAFRWVGGGRHLTSTTHIDNTVEGLLAAPPSTAAAAAPTSSPTASRSCSATSSAT